LDRVRVENTATDIEQVTLFAINLHMFGVLYETGILSCSRYNLAMLRVALIHIPALREMMMLAAIDLTTVILSCVAASRLTR
jgi:hypothetical protein